MIFAMCCRNFGETHIRASPGMVSRALKRKFLTDESEQNMFRRGYESKRGVREGKAREEGERGECKNFGGGGGSNICCQNCKISF